MSANTGTPAPVQDRGGGGRHRPGRGDDLVARLDADGAHGADEAARGPGVDGDRVLDAEVARRTAPRRRARFGAAHEGLARRADVAREHTGRGSPRWRRPRRRRPRSWQGAASACGDDGLAAEQGQCVAVVHRAAGVEGFSDGAPQRWRISSHRRCAARAPLAPVLASGSPSLSVSHAGWPSASLRGLQRSSPAVRSPPSSTR